MLSIIVPVYNTSKFIPQCVESILNQTYKDFEIILVNDGSTDNSKEICEEYANKNECVRVINKKNGGLISAWTEGTYQAKGDYVGYIDSDDYIEENYFEVLKFVGDISKGEILD